MFAGTTPPFVLSEEELLHLNELADPIPDGDSLYMPCESPRYSPPSPVQSACESPRYSPVHQSACESPRYSPEPADQQSDRHAEEEQHPYVVGTTYGVAIGIFEQFYEDRQWEVLPVAALIVHNYENLRCRSPREHAWENPQFCRDLVWVVAYQMIEARWRSEFYSVFYSIGSGNKNMNRDDFRRMIMYKDRIAYGEEVVSLTAGYIFKLINTYVPESYVGDGKCLNEFQEHRSPLIDPYTYKWAPDAHKNLLERLLKYLGN